MMVFVKIVVSALIITLATEMARYHRLLAAIVISLPLISIMSFIWIYLASDDVEKLAIMSMDVFWLVLLSLPFFLIFSLLLRMQYGFWLALGVASLLLVLIYLGVTFIKSHF